jgi:hypothetical protein
VLQGVCTYRLGLGQASGQQCLHEPQHDDSCVYIISEKMLRLCMYRWRRREAGRVTFKARETWELYCRPSDRGVASPAPSYEVSISRTASPVACAGMADVVPC